MRRFSANLGFLWPDKPLPGRIDAAAASGFKAVELHWPYDIPAATVRERCERNGVILLGVNTVRGDVVEGDAGLGALSGREDEFQAAVDQSIRYCIEAGGRAIHCMAGNVLSERRRDAQETFVQNLRAASARASAYGLILLLEPLNPPDASGYFYSTLSEAVSVLEEVDRPNVKLMFDAYHVGMVGGDVITELENTTVSSDMFKSPPCLRELSRTKAQLTFGNSSERWSGWVMAGG